MVNQAHADVLYRYLHRALDAVDPYAAVMSYLQVESGILSVAGRQYRLADYDRILVVGGGKAGAPMVRAAEAVFQNIPLTGLVNVKDGYTAPTTSIRLHEARHPLPDERGVAGAREIAALLRSSTARDLVLALLSGGGSALLTLPVPEVTLQDKQALTDLLLRSGATINDINTVRKHLSQIKGGHLARLAQPSPVIALMLSDVVGDPLDVIASGPTSPDPTTYADALEVLRRFDLMDAAPANALRYLEEGARAERPETPKADDLLFAAVHNVVVGSNRQAAQAVITEARQSGFQTIHLTSMLQGEAREVARVIVAIIREVTRSNQPVGVPACLVFGGETTVTVRGSGTGGRASELALAAAIEMEGLADCTVMVAATDGSDGPTDAAGALVDGSTVRRAQVAGLNARAYLANNDSYSFFASLGDIIRTGPTNTNVNDLIIALVFPPSNTAV